MPLRARFLLWAVLTHGAMSSPALATSFMPRPFPDTVKGSPTVVRGHIGAQYANWVTGPDGQQRIYTFTEIQVDEWLKGKPIGNQVVVRELGGEKEGVGMQVAGTAQFSRGEDVVVMISEQNTDDRSYDVQGMMMGKLNVERSSDGKEILVGPAIQGDPDEHVANPAERSQKWTLESFRDLLHKQGGLISKPQSSPSGQPRQGPDSAPVEETTTPADTSAERPSKSEAPRLQSVSTEETTHSSHTVEWLAAGGLVIAVALAVLLRRK